MKLLEILLSTCEGLTILALTLLMGGLATALVALIEISQYVEEDTFYESH